MHLNGNSVRYSSLVAIAIGLCVLFAGCDSSDPADVAKLPQNSQLRHSSQPIGAKAFLDADRSIEDFDFASSQFKEQLQRLAHFADAVRNGDEHADPPDVLTDQFETTFLERNHLTSAYLGEKIRIARWRISDKTPTYYDSIALRRLFETLLRPWEDAKKFRIEFQVHTVRDRPNYFDTQVLVDVAGDVPAKSIQADGTNDIVGRAAIGIWQIIWQKQTDGSFPRIKKINMIGHEETVNHVTNGQLFTDCAGSVLRNSPSTVQSLSFGLDQWAKRIPWLDVTGDNGLAIGDINNDGMDDVYVCQPHAMPNLLLRQNADGTADEIALDAAVNLYDDSKAALLIDIDNDGRQDLIVATDSRLVLFSNSGDENFQFEHQLTIGPGTESLSAADFDKDGDLDLFLAKYRPVAKFNDVFPQPNSNTAAVNGGRNILLRNDEAWNFTDVTSEVGMSLGNSNYTNAGVWVDFDTDGDLDLYLANDFHRDKLFTNENGWFTDSFKTTLASQPANSTTVSVADLDRDGKPDFFVGSNSSFEAQRITQNYIDTGGKILRDANSFGAENRFVSSVDARKIDHYQFRSPIFSSQSTYSSVTGDFNCDGFEDIAATNGWLSRRKTDFAEATMLRNWFNPQKDLELKTKKDQFGTQHQVSDMCRQGISYEGFQRNVCLLTLGSKRFSNYSNSSGINVIQDGRGIARTDWDGDGDIDLIINSRTAPRLRIFKNNYDSMNQYLKLRLRGTRSNRDAIGTRVDVFLRGMSIPLTRTLTAGSGRKSQSSKEVHFGLGRAVGIEKIVVHWPNSEPQSFAEIQTNKTYELVEGAELLAEQTEQRYRIALDDKSIPASNGLPDTERKRFFPTARLPILEYRGPSDSERPKWYEIENVADHVLLCLFCPADQDNTDLLRQWNGQKHNFLKMNADLTVAFTGHDVDGDQELRAMSMQIEDAGFEFRWGVLSAGSNSKLAHCCGEWFFDYRLPQKPFALLMDTRGNIHFAYDHDQLTWKTIEPDLRNLADKNFVLNRIPERQNEPWVQTLRTPRLDRLQMRYAETGYVRDASRFDRLLGPLKSDNYLRRAIDLASKGSLASALSAVEKSLELNPNSTEALIEQANMFVAFSNDADQQTRTRMLHSAGELLDKAIMAESSNADAVLARAEVFRLQNDIENALNLLIKFLKIDPEHWETYAIVGRLYFHKREDFEATKYLIKAIENRPTLPYVAGDLGFLYLKNRQFDDAKEFLELATRLQPSELNARRHLGEAEFWLGNFERAGALLEKTVETQPTMSHAKQILAWLKGVSPYASFRDGAEGLKLITPFNVNDENQSPATLEIMAACFAELGDFDSAREKQELAIEAIENNRTLEKYSEAQLTALRDRLELYKRQRAYRLKDAFESPLKLLGGS